MVVKKKAPVRQTGSRDVRKALGGPRSAKGGGMGASLLSTKAPAKAAAKGKAAPAKGGAKKKGGMSKGSAAAHKAWVTRHANMKGAKKK